MSGMVVFGLIASMALLFAFAMLNTGRWTADHYPYQLLNLIGASFFVASAASPFNVGVFWTELIWALISLYGMASIWARRRSAEHTVTSEPTAE